MDRPKADLSLNIDCVESLFKTLHIDKRRAKKPLLSYNPFERDKISKRETKKLIFKIGSQHKNVLIRKKSTKSTGKAQQTETKHISDITEKMAKIWNESGYRDIESTCTPKLAPLAQDDTKVAETNGEINEKFSNKTCARQAMHDYCDSSVTELAAYLDETLYIPKKMSFMAEMMYT